MNLYYYDEYYYWCLVALMQFAASIAYLLTEYTYFLDTKTKSGLLTMQLFNLSCFILMLWTRGFHYGWICYNLLLKFYNDKAWAFVYSSLVIFTLFAIFNVFAIIVPFFKRTVKWFRKSIVLDVVVLSESKKVQ
jgi:hypothetical protein